jgi:D-amino-acid dehydrogenase
MSGSELRIAVVGAGVIGCCIALVLQKGGARVTLIDRDDPGSGCSYGNSGAISESSVAPLAMPGILASVPRMLLDGESPLHLPPHHWLKETPWLMRFVA